MDKDILNLKSEEDLKEYLKEEHINVLELYESIKDNLIEARETDADTIFSINSVEDLDGLDLYSIYYYIQAIQALALKRDEEASNRLGRNIQVIQSRLNDIPAVWEAMQIKNHWETFNKHLEENPTIKEEWDSLCMAIKLTEGDE